MTMNDAYEHWREAALTPTYTPLSDDRIVEMFTLTASVGPANCWTGTSGDPCRMIYALLIDRANIIKRMEAK